MHKNIVRGLNAARRTYARLFGPEYFGFTDAHAQFEGQAASDLIKKKLLEDGPLMACRFGSGELSAVLNYVAIKNAQPVAVKAWKYVKGESMPFWWDEPMRANVCRNAGVFPNTEEIFVRFAELMLRDMQYIDILGVWMKEENILKKYFEKAVTVRLPDLEPYYHADPWSEVLKGRKVLVIHPFEESIRRQYAKREFLFADKRVLPEFELITMKAVQTVANNTMGFKDWFEALDAMCEKISKTDFDVAIIGCGAYGLPLAAHVKRMGRKAIHLGGATQILFGVKGKRWEENKNISKFFNEHWINPGVDERPENYKMIEEGCYW